MFFGAIVAFGLGPAVWIGGTFATAEADSVPDRAPQPVPSVSISTVYIAVEPSDTPDVSDIADAWVPPSPSESPSASPSPVRSSPSVTPSLSTSPSGRPSASASPAPSASVSTPPVEHTPTPSASVTPSAEASQDDPAPVA